MPGYHMGRSAARARTLRSAHVRCTGGVKVFRDVVISHECSNTPIHDVTGAADVLVAYRSAGRHFNAWRVVSRAATVRDPNSRRFWIRPRIPRTGQLLLAAYESKARSSPGTSQNVASRVAGAVMRLCCDLLGCDLFSQSQT